MIGRWTVAQWRQVLMMVKFQLMQLERAPMDSDDPDRKKLLQEMHRDVLIQLQELLRDKETGAWGDV